MYITNAEELVEELKPRLREYLTLMLGEEAQKNKICCYVHNEKTPSMYYNPKTAFTTVHCFGCGASHDIFGAAAELENLPTRGPEWMTQTLPHLAEKLGVEVQLGEPSAGDRARGKLFKLAADIAGVLSTSTTHLEYLQERKWSDEHLLIGTIAVEELKSKLLNMGWTSTDLDTSFMIETQRQKFFGENLVTFTIKDYRGRPVGFVSRNLGDGVKYINTPETMVYEKRKALLGIDTALKSARQEGLYVVEGPGDLAALHRVGVKNVAAICGTAFTADHLSLLKMLGIRKVFFALDWDEAGSKAIHRILKEELKFAPGVSCYVVSPPEGEITDPSDLLAESDTGELFESLKKVPAFEWVLGRIGDSKNAEELCEEMVPIIASEQTAVRREMFVSALSEFTGVSHQSIDHDVRSLRDGKAKERDERLQAAAESYVRAVVSEPSNISALMAEHESFVEHINKEYNKGSIGVNYQLAKYEALQERRQRMADAGISTEFVMKWFSLFGEAMAGGQNWTDGCLIYVGGRANSGKTASVIGIGLDVALHDPDAIVVMHFTDDNYAQVEPRIKTNIALMTMAAADPHLTIGMANNPQSQCLSKDYFRVYQEADSSLRDLIATEKLIILDAEDGSTLGTLEKNLRHIRRRFPDKKIMVVADNTHNYMDYLQLDQPTRMTRISNTQKNLTGKYRCCMIATAEYRKNAPVDSTKMKLPVDDDLADARALMYRPNAIIHVYNDSHDRKDAAEITWTSDREEHKGKRLPRLMWVVSKNKISGFKDKLIADLDPSTVGLKQYSAETAREDQIEFINKVNAGEVQVQNGMVVEADWE